MPTARERPSVIHVNDGRSSELLVVTGGYGVNYDDVVEVLVEREWATVQSLPEACLIYNSTLHNGILYIYIVHYLSTE